MGRYYSGDIEGKLWFGVQSTDDAEFFGGESCEAYWSEDDEDDLNAYGIAFTFTTDNMPEIEVGLESCLKALEGWKEKLDAFFDANESYNDKQLCQELGFEWNPDNKTKVHDLLVWYARLDLGKKIYGYVKENGECNFECEY